MKTVLHILTLSLVAFVPLALANAADDEAKPKTAPNKRAEMAEKTFKTLDKDQDGVLTFDEFKGKRKAKAMDKAEEIFKLIDADGDLKLTMKEFKNKPLEVRFKQMDKDNDGKLTFDEFKGKREKPEEVEKAEQTFKRMDANGDKVVSLDEFKASQRKSAGKKKGKKAAKKKFQPEVLKAAKKE